MARPALPHAGAQHAETAAIQPMFGPDGWARMYRRGILATDAAVLALMLVAAHALWFAFELDVRVAGALAPSYAYLTPAIWLLWWGLLVGTHSADPRILGHGSQEFVRVLTASWYTFAIVAVTGFLFKWDISRGYLLIAIVGGVLSLLLYRAVWRFVVHSRRDRGLLQARVLVVGTSATAQPMVERLNSATRAGYRVVGVAVPPGAAPDVGTVLGVPMVGELVDPVAVAQGVGAEYIVLSGSESLDVAAMRQLGWDLEGSGIGLIVAPGMMDVAGPRVMTSPVEGLPLLHINEPQFTGLRVGVKFAFDKIGAALLLIVMSVPMLVIAGLIKATSPGPALFAQQRAGHNGQAFRMWKFRSMVVGADQRKEDLLDSNEGNGVHFKMRRDPRVTPIGRVLRRFSMDELPQLFNVLNGTMSMVGPRPMLLNEVEAWDDRVIRRQLVRPGMTGLWQVSGRSDLSWEMTVRLDLYYTENWSLWGDLLILARTVLAVVRPRGAY